MDTYENNGLNQEAENTAPEAAEQTIPEAAAEQPQQTPAEPVQGSAAGPEQIPAQPEAEQPYHGLGTGRRESPFANSPYVSCAQPEQTYQAPPVQQPVKKQPKAKKKGGRKAWKGVLAAVLALVVVAGSCGITAALVNNYWQGQTDQMKQSFSQQVKDLQSQIDNVSKESSSISGTPVSADGSLTPSQVYAANVESVVAISNQATTNYYGQVSETASSGSGFILTEDGYVVSNYHVVEGATTLTVILHDGTEYDAKLVGGDETNDVALLKIEATGLPAVTIGSSDDLVVGDQVVAIGNPLGELTSTQTVGYISAKDRDVTTDGTTINMMQTDAAINPGNSGGPLFNMKGEVIGITTAKYSGTTTSGASIEGIGFAIPIDDVMGIISDLKEYGYVTGAYLGVTVRSMDADVANAYGLPVGSQVASVESGSCSEKAGLKMQDIIMKLGEYEIEDNTDLLRALRKFKAGDTTTITVWRSGRELTLTITLDEKPQQTTQEEETVQQTQPQQEESSGYSNPFFPFFGG